LKYTVDEWVFEKNPDMLFGIIVGEGLQNTETSKEDSEVLKKSEQHLREKIKAENIKTTPCILRYRDALSNVDINPNKYMNSVEAMSKRVIKGSDLPRINALVDLCNAISLKHVISLGGHDLRDIESDLEVRKSVDGDVFLPFGETEFEVVPAGEVVFTSGDKVQTRQWLWRQSELGKLTLDSQNIIFQLVGFSGEGEADFRAAMADVEAMVINRFQGKATAFTVDKNKNSIEF